MIVKFKVLGKPIYDVNGEEVDNEQTNYFWEVPDDKLKEAIIESIADYYSIEEKASLRAFIDDVDLWDILEDYYEDEVTEYIQDNFEDEAMQDYYEEGY